MTEDKLIARAKAETLREVADVLAGEAKLYSGTHHGDIINNTAIGFRARAAALDAGVRPQHCPKCGVPGYSACSLPGCPGSAPAPQPAREGGEKLFDVVGSGPPGGWFNGESARLGEGDRVVFLPDGTYRNGTRTDGVTLTREEVDRLVAVLESVEAIGQYNAEWLRARLGAGE